MARMLSWLVVAAFAAMVFYVSASAALADVPSEDDLDNAKEKKVSIDNVPKAVKKAILKAVGKGKLVDIGEFVIKGKKYYEIEMIVKGKEYDVLFDEKGKVLRKTCEDGDE